MFVSYFYLFSIHGTVVLMEDEHISLAWCVLTCLLGHISALLLWHILAVLLWNYLTLLLGQVLADFVLNIVAVLHVYSLTFFTRNLSRIISTCLTFNVPADLSRGVNTSFFCCGLAHFLRDALALLSWDNVALLH